MVWQDIVIMAASLIFSISLVPLVYNGFKEKKGFITLATSGPTFVGLCAVAVSLFTLSLFFSSIVTAFTATLWLILFIQRIIYSKA